MNVGGAEDVTFVLPIDKIIGRPCLKPVSGSWVDVYSTGFSRKQDFGIGSRAWKNRVVKLTFVFGKDKSSAGSNDA